MTTTPITEITTKQVHHARIAKATKLADILAAEYPAITLAATLDDLGRVATWIATAKAEDGETITLHDDEQVPELADLLEAAEDAGIDPEAGATEDEDGEKLSGSVVGEHYRERYREASSTGQSCGDWLAEQLANDTIADGNFQIADFEAVLTNNAVDQSGAWARLPQSGQKGWVGRWRMNGRQILEKTVALTGVYVDTVGQKIEPNAGWLAATRTKHAKWIAKQEKLDAEMVSQPNAA